MAYAETKALLNGSLTRTLEEQLAAETEMHRQAFDRDKGCFFVHAEASATPVGPYWATKHDATWPSLNVVGVGMSASHLPSIICEHRVWNTQPGGRSASI